AVLFEAFPCGRLAVDPCQQFEQLGPGAHGGTAAEVLVRLVEAARRDVVLHVGREERYGSSGEREVVGDGGIVGDEQVDRGQDRRDVVLRGRRQHPNSGG